MTTKAMHTECPCCGAAHQLTTGLNCATGPKPGDVTVCASCGAICSFDRDLALELLRDPSGPDLAIAREAQRRVRIRRGLPV